jgi:hypothetical protein
MIPADLLGRWSQWSKKGKRALQAFCEGVEEAKTREKLEEAVEGLNVVCDQMMEWREQRSNYAFVGPCVGALIETFCDEAAMRHVLVVGLNASNCAVALIAWKLEPCINGPLAEQVRTQRKNVFFFLFWSLFEH